MTAQRSASMRLLSLSGLEYLSCVPVVALVLALSPAAMGQDAKKSTEVLKPSALSIPAASFGPNWTGPKGVVVDDFNAAPPKGMTQQALDVMKQQMGRSGICGMADFTYTQKGNPLATVTLRVFLFETAEQCQTWMTNKYRGRGSERRYKKLDKSGNTLDSIETNKRICARGRVWLTCSNLQKNNEHLKFVEKFLAKIAKAQKPTQKVAPKEGEKKPKPATNRAG